MSKVVCLPVQNTTRKSAKLVQPPSLVQTIFHEPWWMDIACEGSSREAIVSSGGLIVGRLPYHLVRRPLGLSSVLMPRYAHVLGPAIAPQFTGDNFPRSLKEYSIVGELLAQLPPAAHVSFRLHGGIANTLAFEARGFVTSAAYTVEIAPDEPGVLWRRLRDKTRNVIRRAKENLEVSESEDIEDFLAFYARNLKSKGRRNEYDSAILSRLIDECITRGTGRILLARASDHSVQAAVFTVWDSWREYYFMSSRNADSLNGATSLLIWEALQHASSLGLTFDMDCLHVTGGEVPNLLLLTGFGGEIKPRYQVQKTTVFARLGRLLWKSAASLR